MPPAPAIVTARRVPMLLVLLLWVAHSAAYLDLKFNQEQYFGPDGPWQAVEVDVAYLSNTSTPHTVNLIPALLGAYTPAAWLINRRTCKDAPSDSHCGAGGVIPSPQQATILHINYTSWNSFSDIEPAGYFFNYSGPVTGMQMQITTDFNMYGVAVGVANKSHVEYPNNKIASVETGLLSMGYSVTSDSYINDPPNYAAYETVTQSSTWSLHMGAATLGYPGSLVFGGYDRGRVISPVLSFTAENSLLTTSLKDITLGVEEGKSPFDFNSKSGLLVSENGPVTAALPATLYPQFPYIGLSTSTLNAITTLLPVQFNSDVGYYLWKTDDPAYTKIVSSPAYLGFVFTDGTNDVTIKVPFKLLNLTLESTASGLSYDVPYLPLVGTVDPVIASDSPLLIGRAFLQSAVIGSNWGNNASWLAQAPGPGASKNGLGVDMQDLPASATAANLKAPSGDSLFRNSWSNYWTATGTSGSTSGSGGGGQSSSSSSSLSGGAIGGIVVGAIAAIAIVGALIYFFLRRKKRQEREAARPTEPTNRPMEQTTDTKARPADNDVRELDGNNFKRWSELETKEKAAEFPQSSELETNEKVAEFPGHYEAHELPTNEWTRPDRPS